MNEAERAVLKAAEAYVQAIEPDGGQADLALTAAVEALWAARQAEDAGYGKKDEYRIRVTVRTETTYWFPYDDDNPDVDPRYEDITNADLDGFVLEHFNAEMPVDVLRSSESVILHGPSSRGLMSNAYEPFDPGFIIAPEDVRRWKERQS